jgi:hypothetical protein
MASLSRSVVGPWAWVRSVPAAAGALLAGRTHCIRHHVGESLLMSDGRTYTPFRHTVKEPGRATDGEPAVLQPRFHLRFMGPQRRRLHAMFRVVCIVTTPFFVGLAGFRSKLWMVDPVTGDFAGLYQWDDAEGARAYAEGLSKVLRALSTPGSVSYELRPATTVEEYLEQANQTKTPRPERAAASRGTVRDIPA